MQLLRLGAVGAERPAVRTDDGTVHDLSPLTDDIDGAFLASGGIARVREALAQGSLPVLDADGLRFGPPLARPGKIVCIGLNYRDHAAETGAAIPAEPILFLKARTRSSGRTTRCWSRGGRSRPTTRWSWPS